MADWNDANKDTDTYQNDPAFDATGEIPVITDSALTHPKGMRPFLKKHKRLFLGGGIAAIVIAAIIGLFRMVFVLSDPLYGYAEAEVVKGNVIRSIPAEGTLSANARYNITSLVSGKITASDLQVGDTVTAGTVLFQLDDTEAKLALERAKNELSKSIAMGTVSTADSNKIYATASGTIHTLNIRSGKTVSYGQVVATVKKSDDSVVAITSPFAGTVSSVYVSEGSNVSINSPIASITGSQTTNNQKAGVYDQKSNELAVQAAEAQLKHYTITSPTDGVIVEKNAKVGDNVSITNSENPMMVILDNSSLKFTFLVDETTVRDLESGLEAMVSSNSFPDQPFAGEVTRVAAEGVPDENGTPMFEVDVTVYDPQALKAGTKVTATIILEAATNVMYVPHRALMEADGENAVVLVKDTAIDQSLASSMNGALAPSVLYPWIQVPEGCKLVAVKYSVGNGEHVAILSGLSVGDIVVYDPDAEPINLKPEPTEQEADEPEALPVKEESEDEI